MQPLLLAPRAIQRPGSPIPEATVTIGNLLEEGAIEVPMGAKAIVAWSGWAGEGADADRGLFERDVRTWGPAAWTTLAAACDRLLPELAGRGMDLCLRPHARHVLSDPQRCLTFLRARESQPVRLLLGPAAFLTGSMLPTAQDHLDRALSALGGHPGVWGLLLTSVERAFPGKDDDLLRPAPLGSGLLDPGLIVSAWRRHCPPALPCVILDRDAAAQAAILAAA